MSGKALAAGFSAAQEPVASAIPLSYFFADPYPSKAGFTPPQLARDVMQVWADVARENGYVFSAYYNMLCHHSGVAEQYLWPMIDEIMERYHPGGFWFDGSWFTATAEAGNTIR